MFPMTPWTKRLLIANIAVFVVTSSSPALVEPFVLYPPRIIAQPWMVFTAFTYMFLHAGLGHLFFNMLGLFFGPRLESRLGSKGFLLLYFLSGLGGALFSFIFARQAPWSVPRRRSTASSSASPCTGPGSASTSGS